MATLHEHCLYNWMIWFMLYPVTSTLKMEAKYFSTSVSTYIIAFHQTLLWKYHNHNDKQNNNLKKNMTWVLVCWS
jgi:TM2 domain-containing membrane protein YozV